MDAGGPLAVAHEGDVGGVPAEAADVLLDPVQRRDLVQDPQVGGVLALLHDVSV